MSQLALRRSASVRRLCPVARVPPRLFLVVPYLCPAARHLAQGRPGAATPPGHSQDQIADMTRGRPGAAAPRLHPAALATRGGPRLRPRRACDSWRLCRRPRFRAVLRLRGFCIGERW